MFQWQGEAVFVLMSVPVNTVFSAVRILVIMLNVQQVVLQMPFASKFHSSNGLVIFQNPENKFTDNLFFSH